MGQVIHLDFTARKTRPIPAATAPQDPVSIVDVSETAVGAPPSGVIGEGRQPRARTLATAGGQPPIQPRATTDAPPAQSLVASCAEMRTHTDALTAAIADLKRASADLADLPRLAREFCEAAL